jgi:hypothetical protein
VQASMGAGVRRRGLLLRLQHAFAKATACAATSSLSSTLCTQVLAGFRDVVTHACDFCRRSADLVIH